MENIKKETENIPLALSKYKCKILVVFDTMQNTTRACLAAGGLKPPKSHGGRLKQYKKKEGNIRPLPKIN